MKRIFVVLALLASILVAAPATEAAMPQAASPPGQLYVVSVNTYQNQIIGTERFRMMLELARALLNRPAAFDGGSRDVAAAPDVIMLQEMRESNLEIFEKLLRQRSEFNYEIVGATTTHGDFIINVDRVAMAGEPHVWTDPCYAQPPADASDNWAARMRSYQWAPFIELETGAPFAAASVHFSKSYRTDTGHGNCLERNIAELRRQLEPASGTPTIIGGDFNRRAVQEAYECDMQEQSAPLAWWLDLTAPSDGVAYSDAVKTFHQQRGLSLETEWTHEQKAQTVSCDTTTRFRRTRIDYLFTSGMELASVHTDHPGWSGGAEPGTRHPVNARYSDHRFIAGRFGLVGPSKPAPVTLVPAAGGLINVAWSPPDIPVAGWILYRAVRNEPYSVLARLTPDVLSYQDLATQHGRRYRYALAAVDASGAQGVESDPATATADARGPRITSRSPGRNGVATDRRADIVVRYDEPVDPESVSYLTINLYKNGRRVCGTTSQQSGRVLVLDPCFSLGKRKDYKVVVRPVSDRLGNRGSADSWTFTTR